MRAGPMKYKLKLLQPVHTVNAYGEEQTTYKAVRTVWAERVAWSGKRSEEASEHFPDHTAQYRIRIAHPVRENWRVEQLGGETFNVVAIEPNISRGMLTLSCEKLNP